MKLLNYKQFVNETNLMMAVSRGSQVDRIDFEKHEPDAFIDQEEIIKKCSVPGKDKECKTIFNSTENEPELSTKISTY